MTENEAIECLKCYRAQSGTSFPEEIEMAVNALEEIEQYRAIGTPEELKAAMKYVYLAKKHGTVGQVIENCVKYEAIGTVMECREAVEKQTAKKVKSIFQVKDGDSYVGIIGRCPCCGDILEEDTVYCDCGQKLDWSGEE
jgi:hypothetical protein